jgi:hypothetical protein
MRLAAFVFELPAPAYQNTFDSAMMLDTQRDDIAGVGLNFSDLNHRT